MLGVRVREEGLGPRSVLCVCPPASINENS